MPRPTHDTPYRDEAPTQATSRSASARPARSASVRHRSPAAHQAHATATVAKPPARRTRRRNRGGRGNAPVELTSQPTGRAAYSDTRAWLLEQHGPVCAYCARRFTARVMTLDHVAPRRGQSAYDRRDNLVLACPGCNMAKRDLAPLAFLLGARDRAANLLRYGTHLSAMLLDMARSLAPEGAGAPDEDDDSPYRD